MAIYQRNVPLENDNNESGVGNCIEMEFMVGQADCRAKVILCDGEYDIDQNGNIVVLVGKQASLINCAPGMLDVNIVEQTVFPQYDNTGTGVADFYDNVTNVPGVHIEGYETGTPLRAATLSITIGGSPVSVSDISIRPMQTIANIGLMPKIAEWHIYGNSEQGRFSIKKPDNGANVYYLDNLTQDVLDKKFSRILSFKEYEIKDHLGNVRTVISDFKQPATLTQTRGTQPYIVDERSVNDYYPYGMLIPERSWSSTDYRYGYGGHELDNEVKGTGNHLSFGDFGLDPRVGRRWNPDPVVQPGVSGYVVFNNNPNYFIDIDGYKATPFPFSQIGSLQYYVWRKKDFEKRNPGKRAPNYYADYGDKYIQRFTNETNKQLSAEGQAWLKVARKKLQIAMEDELAKKGNENLELDEEKFKAMAFRTHVDAYWKAGLKDLNTVDLVAIVLTPNFNDLMSKEGIEQAQQIVGKLVDHWINNPSEGAERLAELLINKEKIEFMVKAKIVREAVDPDKAIKVFNKITELIPTIKIDIPTTSKKQ